VTTSITEIRFHRDRPGPVAEAMGRLSARGDGAGWINLHPVLSDEEHARLPDRSGMAAWFSGRGPAVAMATWLPAAPGPRPRPAQIGLEHGTGPKALDRLAELGAPLPAGWTKRQDHAKHGVVAELPADIAPGAVLTWLIVAATLLRTMVEPGEEWLALVHEPA